MRGAHVVILSAVLHLIITHKVNLQQIAAEVPPYLQCSRRSHNSGSVGAVYAKKMESGAWRV
jgi:hypothetical protein